MSSEIVMEGQAKVTIMEIKKLEKPSSYTDGNYILAFIVDQYDRKIAAAGKWVENWQVGDEVEGILQEKATMQGRDGSKKAIVSSSLFLKNPKANY